jgi:hypothetical protein
VQEVLAAHQRAVDARIEEGLQEIRLAVSEAVGRAVEPPLPAEDVRPERAGSDDVVRGLIAHTEERFQALSLRLRRIEDVLRQVAKREGPDVEVQIEGMRRSITSIAATQQQELARLMEGQRRGTAQLQQDVRTFANALRKDHRASAEALAKHHRAAAEVVTREQRAAIEEMGIRIGRGIAAIAKQLRDDLAARQDALLERSLRGLASELRRQGGLRSEARREPREAIPPRPTSPPSRLTQTAEPMPEQTPVPDPAAPVIAEAETAAADPAANEPVTGHEPEPRPEPRRYLIERKRPTEPYQGGSEPDRT